MQDRTQEEQFVTDCANVARFLHEYMHDFWTRFQKNPPPYAMENLMDRLTLIRIMLNPSEFPSIRDAARKHLTPNALCPFTQEEIERRKKYDKKNPHDAGDQAQDKPDNRGATRDDLGGEVPSSGPPEGKEKGGSLGAGTISAPDWRTDTPPEYNWSAPGLIEAKE
jgi:hypothetical protein